MSRVNNTVHSRIRCSGNVFTEPFPNSALLFLFIKNVLPSNGRYFFVIRGRCLENNAVSEP
jgi:hypothetical protein